MLPTPASAHHLSVLCIVSSGSPAQPQQLGVCHAHLASRYKGLPQPLVHDERDVHITRAFSQGLAQLPVPANATAAVVAAAAAAAVASPRLRMWPPSRRPASAHHT